MYFSGGPLDPLPEQGLLDRPEWGSSHPLSCLLQEGNQACQCGKKAAGPPRGPQRWLTVIDN